MLQTPTGIYGSPAQFHADHGPFLSCERGVLLTPRDPIAFPTAVTITKTHRGQDKSQQRKPGTLSTHAHAIDDFLAFANRVALKGLRPSRQ